MQAYKSTTFLGLRFHTISTFTKPIYMPLTIKPIKQGCLSTETCM